MFPERRLISLFDLFLPPANEVCEGYVFTGVCLSTGGDVRDCSGGACMVALGGHVWLLRGGHPWLFLGGACVVAPGGCVVALGGHAWLLPGGHAWLLRGGVRGCSGGGCAWLFLGGCMVARGECMGYDEIWRYGQWAGGTHPTGMHSCYLNWFVWFIFFRFKNLYIVTSSLKFHAVTWIENSLKISL